MCERMAPTIFVLSAIIIINILPIYAFFGSLASPVFLGLRKQLRIFLTTVCCAVASPAIVIGIIRSENDHRWFGTPQNRMIRMQQSDHITGPDSRWKFPSGEIHLRGGRSFLIFSFILINMCWKISSDKSIIKSFCRHTIITELRQF